jgi:hypothetical protein
MSYKFNVPPERPATWPDAPLQPGDYSFVVADIDKPYEKANGNWVCKVKLIIEPSKMWVWAYPWSGTDRNGEARDGIAEFLLSCARAPKPGGEPDWNNIINARGRCRLEIETAGAGSRAGQEVNRVARFHTVKQVGPGAEPPRTSFTPEEYKKSRAEIAKTVGGSVGPDLDAAPDDIPF